MWSFAIDGLWNLWTHRVPKGSSNIMELILLRVSSKVLCCFCVWPFRRSSSRRRRRWTLWKEGVLSIQWMESRRRWIRWSQLTGTNFMCRDHPQGFFGSWFSGVGWRPLWCDISLSAANAFLCITCQCHRSCFWWGRALCTEIYNYRGWRVLWISLAV